MDTSNWIAVAAIVVSVILWLYERRDRKQGEQDERKRREKLALQVEALTRIADAAELGAPKDPTTVPAHLAVELDLPEGNRPDPTRPRLLGVVVVTNAGPGNAELRDVALLNASPIRLEKGSLRNGAVFLRPGSPVRMNVNLPRDLRTLDLQLQWADVEGEHREERTVNVA